MKNKLNTIIGNIANTEMIFINKNHYYLPIGVFHNNRGGPKNLMSTSVDKELKLNDYYAHLREILYKHKEENPETYNSDKNLLKELQLKVEKSIHEVIQHSGFNLIEQPIKQLIIRTLKDFFNEFTLENRKKIPQEKHAANRMEYIFINKIINTLKTHRGVDPLCFNIAPLIIILLCRLYPSQLYKNYCTSNIITTTFQRHLFDELIMLFISIIPSFLEEAFSDEEIQALVSMGNKKNFIQIILQYDAINKDKIMQSEKNKINKLDYMFPMVFFCEDLYLNSEKNNALIEEFCNTQINLCGFSAQIELKELYTKVTKHIFEKTGIMISIPLMVQIGSIYKKKFSINYKHDINGFYPIY